MHYLTKIASPETLTTQCLILGVFDGKQHGSSIDRLPATPKKHIQATLKKGDLGGKAAQSLLLYGVPGLKAERVLLMDLGEQKSFDAKKLASAMGGAIALLNKNAVRDCALMVPEESADMLYAAGRDIAISSEEQLYLFDQCKSKKNRPKKPLGKLTLVVKERKQLNTLKKALKHGTAIAAGMNLAKDLANLPGNICTPSYLADTAKRLGRKSTKLKATALTEKQMQRLGMGALLSVSRGSREPAKLIVLEYRGGKENSRPVVLVGKGLTFDAGGISIKPSAGMDEMKYDMCGGASVFGTLQACVDLDLPINVIGIVPSSENLPDGEANKPGDIVTSMAGLTIEILNTDAEGRLILCDALTYAERFRPAAVIDIATLTGACVVALGHHTTGLLGNDDKLADELLKAGDDIHDPAWRLPMNDDYRKQLESNFADMANIGGKGAGTITAACFLGEFTKKYKWAHLDIAGTAWKGGHEKGATGRPVPLLTQLLLKRCKLAE
ncbi:MAG TPA: leucyl aminopeptidase [Thiolapillus brandeum]|uniref:Probable cytosol aminopeptidase n=1 Tax=Thiolapillus brandeum TaxID=1076588 RepID=A0A831WEQ7_9GAMM|nr:leucyl aminopeptidase [Thiolapillus brandeum]